MDIVDKTGAWFTFAETRLGQGREAAKDFLRQNAALATEIESRIRAKVAGGDAAVPVEGIEEAE
jgi:recombination protein RecA